MGGVYGFPVAADNPPDVLPHLRVRAEVELHFRRCQRLGYLTRPPHCSKLVRGSWLRLIGPDADTAGDSFLDIHIFHAISLAMSL
jgi:hypothetical protein